MKPSPVRRSARLRVSFVLAALFALIATASPPASAGPMGPQVYHVNTNQDVSDATPGDGVCDDGHGLCSLRAAIEEGNAVPGATRLTPHTIDFTMVPGFVVNISNGSFPAFAAPFLITGPVFINGGGLSCLGFTESGQTGTGYEMTGADGSKMTGVAIGNCNGDAIDVDGHGHLFTGNFIGVDLVGNPFPNHGNGIILSSSHSYGNIIDPTKIDDIFAHFPPLPVQGSDVNTFLQNMLTLLVTLDPITISGNVISGNDNDGVNIHSVNLAAVFVTGNWIGTDPTGKIAMPNGMSGVNLNGDTFANFITGNVISGNTGDGINITGTVLLPNFVMSNVIGPPGAAPGTHIGNGKSGINTSTAPSTDPVNPNPSMIAAIIGPGNFISDNQGAPSNPAFPDQFNTGGAGVYVTGASNGVKVIGNTIGMAEIPLGTPQQTNAYGNAGDGVIITANGNTVSGNVIAGNKRHGIFVNSSNAISTHITGNTIGQYPAFAADKTLGNTFDGVHIDDGSSTAVGGPNAGDGNTIIFNGRNGVKILNGGPSDGWSNLVQANTIYGNAQSGMGGIGIDLDVVPNATDGPHSENIGGSYANLNQAPPVICVGAPGEQAECSGFHAATSAGGMTTLDWTIATHGVAKFHAEFYKIDTTDDNTATSIVLLGTQDIGTTATGVPDPAPAAGLTPCPGGRCTVTLSGSAAGAHVLMTITDISDLLSTAGSSGWQTNLKCFLGDNGIILPMCTANDTSEFSNVADVVSSDASLSNLTISSGMLMPAFASNTLTYADSVTSGTASVTVTPTASDPGATITVNTIAVSSGMASGAITLPVGPSMTPITVVVTAADTVTKQTYTINVSRAGAASNNAALSNLTISSGTLMPAFAMNTLTYSDSVTSGTGSVTVTPTAADPGATITVNTIAVPSGMASGSISLPVGPSMTPITVVVTAADTVTKQTYTINVSRAGAASNNAALSNLTISSGTLMPAFASNTLTYGDSVTSGTASVTVTPTAADPGATITVNTIAVPSGMASGSIALPVGPSMTPITIVVTAADTVTKQTYTINVNRAGAASNNAALSNLTISSGTLMPAFASNTLTYSDSVTSGTGSVTVTPTAADPGATITVNTIAVPSGMASGSISLPVGPSSTPVTIVVTAADTVTKQTYTINVNRAGAASNNAALSNLTISSGTLTPAFAANTLTYGDNVTSGTGSVTVTPTAADPGATIAVNTIAVPSGMASGSISLPVGPSSTPITIVVTAADMVTKQTYTINVNRAGAASNNAALSGLTISSGTLMPAFASNTLMYGDSVTSGTGSVTVTPTAADPGATITVNTIAVPSGMASGAISLPVGPSMTPVTIVVTAADTVTKQTYTISVSRAGAASNNAALSNLTISSGTLTPAFAVNTLTYGDNVTSGTASVTVTPTAADPGATITVNTIAVPSGMASGSISLPVGPSSTPVTIVVTAADTVTKQTYTINVSRAGAASNNAALSNLTISSGTLTPAFAANTLTYGDNVTSGTGSVTVTPTAADPGATITVNTIAVPSGMASGSISLPVGPSSTPVTIVVTAADTVTKQTYTINVNRAGAASNNASLSNLTISSGTLTPAFAANTLTYSDSVTSGTASVTVTPTAADPGATIAVNTIAVPSGMASGSISLPVGPSSTPIMITVTAADTVTKQTYTINVSRAGAASNNAALSNLTISSGTLTPAFAANTLTYSDSVTSGTASVTVTPTAADLGATITVNTIAVPSGMASGSISLPVGPSSTPVTIVVTAADTVTKQTYTINVSRAGAAVVTTFSGTTSTNTGTLTANITGGGASCSFGSASLVGAPVAPPAGVTFPDGLFQFTLTNCVGSVTVHATFPTAFSAGEQYFKYGPTPGSPSAHWYMLGAGNNVSLVGNVATFTIADGGLGDDDLTVNNTIVDAGGPGVVAAPSGNGGLAPTPTLSQWAQLMLMTLLVGFGVFAAGQRARNRAR